MVNCSTVSFMDISAFQKVLKQARRILSEMEKLFKAAMRYIYPFVNVDATNTVRK